ncbi:VOC family protein [Antribacter sp. KLBMP9083]|uniref:VOC family protein n=1 Tax=Antribacter soli TaxID=2910976 RepID=A0AA41U5N9_9MICO|nr:VOC family protein [Antribacter soli]MCF4119551.1 VOC family protein [Antribacter soli]
MATLKDVVFDCRHPASLARFWATALDGYDVAPYDDEELARLRTMGVDDPEDDPSVLVEAPDGGVPRLFFNRVPEPKTVKNRLHLDLRATDREAEVARLIRAGASEVGRHESWVVLADPEGNEFCVFAA